MTVITVHDGNGLCRAQMICDLSIEDAKALGIILRRMVGGGDLAVSECRDRSGACVSVRHYHPERPGWKVKRFVA